LKYDSNKIDENYYEELIYRLNDLDREFWVLKYEY